MIALFPETVAQQHAITLAVAKYFGGLLSIIGRPVAPNCVPMGATPPIDHTGGCSAHLSSGETQLVIPHPCNSLKKLEMGWRICLFLRCCLFCG